MKLSQLSVFLKKASGALHMEEIVIVDQTIVAAMLFIEVLYILKS